MTPPRPASGAGGGRWLPWVVAGVVLVGALVLAGRLLGAGDLPAPGSSTTAAGVARPVAPPGSVEVEGVRMAPAGSAFEASCRRAADRRGFAVPCPTLLPIPASGPPPAGLCREALDCTDDLVWLGMEGFVVPPGFTGAPGTLGALAILASSDPRMAVGMERWCPRQRPIPAPPALGEGPVVLATCPAGFQGWSTDSLVLRWSRQGTFITLGLRGASEANRRLLLRLAGSLRLVPPES